MLKFMNAEKQASVTKVCEVLCRYLVACEAIKEFGEEQLKRKQDEVIDRIDKEIINEGVIPKLESYVKEEIKIGAHHDFMYRHNNSNVVYYIDGIPFCSYAALADKEAWLLQLKRSGSYRVGNKLPDDVLSEVSSVLSDFVKMDATRFMRRYCTAIREDISRPGAERLMKELCERMAEVPIHIESRIDLGEDPSNPEEVIWGNVTNSNDFLLDAMQFIGLSEDYDLTYVDGEYTINEIYKVNDIDIVVQLHKEAWKYVAEKVTVNVSCNDGNANLSIESLIDGEIGESYGVRYESKIFDLETKDWLYKKLDREPNGGDESSKRFEAIRNIPVFNPDEVESEAEIDDEDIGPKSEDLYENY